MCAGAARAPVGAVAHGGGYENARGRLAAARAWIVAGMDDRSNGVHEVVRVAFSEV
jgi:hypothetical protein